MAPGTLGSTAFCFGLFWWIHRHQAQHCIQINSKAPRATLLHHSMRANRDLPSATPNVIDGWQPPG